MEGHTNNVPFTVFHPNLPIIVSTYNIENTLNYALERAWCVAFRKGANEVAIGVDGSVVALKVCILFKNHSPKLLIIISI